MLTMQYAKAMPDVRFNAADPGYTATDFNGHSGTQTVTEGTDADRHPGHRTAYGRNRPVHRPFRARALVRLGSRGHDPRF